MTGCSGPPSILACKPGSKVRETIKSHGPSCSTVAAAPSHETSLASRAAAVADYKRALALGGSRPLPELFDAAGIRFDFGTELIASLMSTIRTELDKLDA